MKDRYSSYLQPTHIKILYGCVNTLMITLTTSFAYFKTTQPVQESVSKYVIQNGGYCCALQSEPTICGNEMLYCWRRNLLTARLYGNSIWLLSHRDLTSATTHSRDVKQYSTGLERWRCDDEFEKFQAVRKYYFVIYFLVLLIVWAFQKFRNVTIISLWFLSDWVIGQLFAKIYIFRRDKLLSCRNHILVFD